MVRRAAMLSIPLLVAGCAGAPARVEQPPAASVRAAIAELALSMVGVPYRFGGADPEEGFDCSGLVHFTYRSHGQPVPRTARAQFEASRRIALADAAQADLVYFSDEEGLSHVGIYLGNGRFVHAPSSGGAVRVDLLDSPWYRRHLVAVARLLP
jgi:cell wall-associated NlpC family hydrolase